MFYLLLLIALVVHPLFKQRRLKPSTRNREQDSMEGHTPVGCQNHEDKQPVPFARKRAAQVSAPQARPSAQPTSTNAL